MVPYRTRSPLGKIEDIVSDLEGSAEMEAESNQRFEIGGSPRPINAPSRSGSTVVYQHVFFIIRSR